VLPAVSPDGGGRHRVLALAESDHRSRRRAGGFAEQDEDDDDDEGDEESLEVEEHVLNQHQWTGEPGMRFRRFAQCRGDLNQGRVHR
jgi:hypothetical protein